MKIYNFFRRTNLILILISGLIMAVYISGSRETSELSNPAEPSSISRYIVIDNVCAWPNLTMLTDNTIAAIIHNTPSHGKMEGSIDCWVSQDGSFWDKLSIPAPNDPNTVRMNVAAGLANNGDLLVICSGWSNEQQQGQPKRSNFRDSHIPVVIARSGDNGKNWIQYYGFPLPAQGWSKFVPFGDIFAGDNNTLYATAYTRGIVDDPSSSSRLYDGRRQSWFFRSIDDGMTWEKVSVIGPDHNETTLLHLGGNNWLAGARLNNPGVVELFYSYDNGASWRDPIRLTDTPRQLPGHLYRLNDGRILFTFGNRVEEESERGVLAKLSSDEGKTWSKPIRIAYLGGDLGYPSSVQRPDGKIVTAYYSSRVDNHNRYHMGVAIWEAPGGARSAHVKDI